MHFSYKYVWNIYSRYFGNKSLLLLILIETLQKQRQPHLLVVLVCHDSSCSQHNSSRWKGNVIHTSYLHVQHWSILKLERSSDKKYIFPPNQFMEVSLDLHLSFGYILLSKCSFFDKKSSAGFMVKKWHLYICTYTHSHTEEYGRMIFKLLDNGLIKDEMNTICEAFYWMLADSHWCFKYLFPGH